MKQFKNKGRPNSNLEKKCFYTNPKCSQLLFLLAGTKSYQMSSQISIVRSFLTNTPGLSWNTLIFLTHPPYDFLQSSVEEKIICLFWEEYHSEIFRSLQNSPNIETFHQHSYQFRRCYKFPQSALNLFVVSDLLPKV